MEALIPILCILAGLLLIVVEVYLIPGFNIIGILGAAFVFFGVGYAYNESGMIGGTIALSASLCSSVLVFILLWRSGAWDRFILSATLKTDSEARSRGEARSRYLGKAAVAVTPLRPTGVVEIEGERVEVCTEGEFIAVGSQVRIFAMDRRRFFARLDTPTTEVERKV